MEYIVPKAVRLNLLAESSQAVSILREDQNHALVSGNKWWKLKYNLEAAAAAGCDTLLTFGGAYSNHLYATAAAARELNIKSIGIVRGERTLPLNPTLSFAERQGMRLVYIDREQYRHKADEGFIKSLKDQFGEFFLIPEGGTNELAIKGVEEWGLILARNHDFDYLILPVGTGGTIAGLINALPQKKIIGFSSLKGGSFLNRDIEPWLKNNLRNWRVETSFHFGGYGKVNGQLIDFITHFELQHEVPLDPIYTGKMMFGLIELLKSGAFEGNSKILALHTGGLQGRSGFNF
ncbi:MAG: 1-aminocyclopropane-1-carboxylate deaminase/D-cysteine desulfhydrase [Cyclobacteriaceae bacterium]|nr:1-aminocyclopropane-1-carboxylate deaminase/D-cysteine desulfhydrase [Cyclobacteriaceae bacterium]